MVRRSDGLLVAFALFGSPLPVSFQRLRCRGMPNFVISNESFLYAIDIPLTIRHSRLVHADRMRPAFGVPSETVSGDARMRGQYPEPYLED